MNTIRLEQWNLEDTDLIPCLKSLIMAYDDYVLIPVIRVTKLSKILIIVWYDVKSSIHHIVSSHDASVDCHKGLRFQIDDWGVLVMRITTTVPVPTLVNLTAMGRKHQSLERIIGKWQMTWLSWLDRTIQSSQRSHFKATPWWLDRQNSSSPQYIVQFVLQTLSRWVA